MSYYRIHPASQNPTDLLDEANHTSESWTGTRDIRDCPACDGMGYDLDNLGPDTTTCPRCDGDGTIENIRAGVSVCRSLDDLYHYIRVAGAWTDDTVIVELAGVESDDDAEDAEAGEVLVHPTSIVSVTPVTDETLAAIWTEEN